MRSTSSGIVSTAAVVVVGIVEVVPAGFVPPPLFELFVVFQP